MPDPGIVLPAVPPDALIPDVIARDSEIATFPAVGAVAAHNYAPTRQACALFNPTNTVTTISESTGAGTDGITWAANPSITWFDGLFHVVFDGNASGGTTEGANGQKVYWKTSADGITWSAARAFSSDATYCNNPVTDGGVHFQPCLMVVGNVLWCVWNNNNTRSYLSKLTSATGKWTHQRFEFINRQVFVSNTVNGAATAGRSLAATFDGLSDWAPFFSNSPAVLADGTVVCPLTFQSQTIDPASPSDAPTFFRVMKANTLFFTADQGATWWMSETLSNGAIGSPATHWEPTVWEAGNGELWVFSRNDQTALANANALLAHRSANRRSFDLAVATGLEVPVSRPYVAQLTPTRWVMSHCDYPHNDTSTTSTFSSNGRQNGSLFFSRRGVDDFVPGINFSGATANQTYPAWLARAGKIYTIFSEDVSGRRSLRLSTLAGVPSSDSTAYICLRRMSEFLGSAPQLLAGSPTSWLFSGSQSTSSAAVFAPAGSAAFASWISPAGNASSLIADSRQATSSAYGVVFKVDGLSIGSMTLVHGLTLAATCYLACSIDNTASKISFFYAAPGDSSMTTVDAYFRSLNLGSNPANNDQVTVNGTTFTFKSAAAAGTDIQIGASAAATAATMATVFAANAMKATNPGTGSARVICARTDQAAFAASSATAAVTVETGTPLSGTTLRVGNVHITSGLPPYIGNVYDLRAFSGTLTAANALFLFNNLVVALGGSTIAGSATDPGAPTMLLDGAATVTDWPDLTAAPATAVAATDGGTPVVKLNGEASASIELPYIATSVTIRFKLSALPTGAEKWVIATFGTRSSAVELTLNGSAPNSLQLGNGVVTTIGDPTAWNSVDVTISKGAVTVSGTSRKLNGPARMFLGAAYPSSTLPVTKSIAYDYGLMAVSDGKYIAEDRIRRDVVEPIVSSWQFSGSPVFSGNPSFSGIPTFTGALALPLSKLANIAAGRILGNNTGASGPPLELTPAQVLAIVAAAMPKHALITAIEPPEAQTNWSALSVSTSDFFCVRATSTAAQNASIGWDVLLAAGTWTLRLYHRQLSNNGIYTVAFDGVTVGTIDGYAASGASIASDVTGIVVATTAIVRVALTMATKNPSASQYQGAISALALQKTA